MALLLLVSHPGKLIILHLSTQSVEVCTSVSQSCGGLHSKVISKGHSEGRQQGPVMGAVVGDFNPICRIFMFTSYLLFL